MTAAAAAAPSPGHERFRERYGPWAVVTGASEGIGREFAECLAQRGFNLVLVARRQALLDEMAARYTARHGVKTRVLALDLSESGAIGPLAEATAGLDVGLVVAAAGYGTSGPLIDGDLAEELRMVDVNCKAVLALSSHFGRAFARRRRSGLVLMSSLLAFQGVPRAANYAATKAYVQTLAEGLRQELAPRGVDVLACAPGPIQSGFGKRANMRMGMAGQSAEVARATLAALGRRSVVRPGWLSKFLEASLAGLPRRGRVWILARVMRGMTRHQDGQAKGRNGEAKGQTRRLA